MTKILKEMSDSELTGLIKKNSRQMGNSRFLELLSYESMRRLIFKDELPEKTRNVGMTIKPKYQS